MKEYEPQKPLISIHIPRCAGSSIDRVLRGWYGEKFFRHGFKEQSVDFRATPYELSPGICISGHFSRRRNKGVQDLYPEVDQFITFLRDPFEIALSQYFYWKKRRREVKIKSGNLIEGSAQDYKSIAAFFENGRKSYMLNFMPCEVTEDNFKEVIDKYYVYIGIVEDLQASVYALAERIGFPPSKVDHVNTADRDEEAPPGVKAEFEKNNPVVYSIYNYILERYKK